MKEKSSPEVDSIIARARHLAEDRGEEATTAHLLLAMVTESEPSTAGIFVRETLELKETELRNAMRLMGSERYGFIDQVVRRARSLAQRAGLGGRRKSRINGLHLLRALASEPESAANKCLVKVGFDTSAVGIAALAGLTGGGKKGLASASRNVRQAPTATTLRAYRRAPEQVLDRGTPAESPSPRAGSPSESSSPRPRRTLKPLINEGQKITSESIRAEQRRAEKLPRLGIARTCTGRQSGPSSGTSGHKPADDKSWLQKLNERKVAEPNRSIASQLTGGEDDQRPLLERLGRDLSAAAAQGELDPLVGRELELDRVIDALNRRRGNVPCVVGEPGVGKTAVAEGLALRLHSGEARGLDGRTIVQINVGDLIAGTGVRGALAERITQLRDEIAALEGEVVLFLDEIHSLLAATGGASGEGAQELRSAMAGGEFPCILATTPDAFRRYIEQDPGFERRLTRIDIEEPTLDESLKIINAGAERYAEHHQVDFTPEALEASVRLTHRYMTERRLPDKAFAVIDLAGARTQRQGLSATTIEAVTEVVAELTGVPVERLAATDAERLLHLEERLATRVIGHEKNIRRLAEALRRNAAGLGGARPVGSFLLLGPTGVGKTETARALAKELFPGGGGMSRFDMSELAEAHSVARLVGAPPGYVGHEAGGQLTEAVRARPYQVVLLDEIEKAHPRVHMLLLQILEDGRLTDGRGRTVDFTHTVVIMTSNLGVGAASKSSIGFASKGATADRGEATIQAARETLPPELWNRFDEVMYFPALTEDQVAEIARLLLCQTADRLMEEKGIRLEFDDSIVELLLASGGYDPTLGARPMRRAVQRLVEAPLAEAVLRGQAREGGLLALTAGPEGVRAETSIDDGAPKP